MHKNKKWVIAILAVFVGVIIIGGSLVTIIDPFFHFHGPLNSMNYIIDNQRYQNDGIAKHWHYDALITGTSMTVNFKTSELDELFNVNSVKVSYSGGSYRELNEITLTALENNSDLKLIVRGVDPANFLDDKDVIWYTSYPTYLYDDNPLNDINYIFNKLAIAYSLTDILYTLRGIPTTSFDDYGHATGTITTGKEAVDASYVRISDKAETEIQLIGTDRERIKANIEQNILQTARNYPGADFYLFFSPYSIYYFDNLNQAGNLKKNLDAEKYIIELLLTQENIHLFSFFGNFDLITDLNNYMDTRHYSPDINSQILVWMKNGEYELTLDNYKKYCEKEQEFLLNYDYDSLFE